MIEPTTENASDGELTSRFKDVMDAISRTNNTTSLADLARRAGGLWGELQRRGVV